MKCIIAQGNPGDQYAASRHNVGFMALDALAERHGATFTLKQKFLSLVAECVINGEKTLLVKPTTYYNETGRAARAIIDFYKLESSTDLLIIHDDLSLPVGSIRTRQKGRDAGNNGIKSLTSHLGPDYARIRVGIYNELRDRMNDATFVLSNFTKNEVALLNEKVLPKVTVLIEDFCNDTFELSSYNLLPPLPVE